MNDLANHLWQSTAFAVFIAVLAFVLRGNQARVRYGLWFSASLKFLVPFSLLVGLGARVDAPAVGPLVPTAAVEQITVSFAPAAATSRGSTSWWPSVIAAVWAVGALVILVSWLRRWVAIRPALRGGVRMPIEAPIPVLSTSMSIEPGIFGIFRPVLLLPEGITASLSAAELGAILAHELAHVRRHDNLTAALHMLVQAAFWFHPLVWWIGRKLVEERERACDEAVLREGNRPEVYAQGILNVCKHYLASPLPCASGVTGADLRERIGEIMASRLPGRLTSVRIALLAIAGTAALLTPLVIGMLNAPRLRAQSSDYKFEVASIRPAAPEQRGTNIHTDRGGFSTRNASLVALIQMAYAVQPYQISGAVGWMTDDRWDIAAKFAQAEEGEIGPAELKRQETRTERVRAHVRNLLAERFGLKLRQEIKELPVFGLTIDKGGSKLKPSANPRGNMNTNQNNSVGTIRGEGVPIKNLTHSLSSILKKPVIDETGLDGVFEISLDWNDSAESIGPSIYTALKEQLGLRLDAKKGPVETYVIEQAEKPSEN